MSTTARNEDYDAIVKTMQLYIDCFNDNDIAKAREAFHEDAWIFYVDENGSLVKNLISECFERWTSPPSWNAVGRIFSVTQAGDAAAVQINFDEPGEPGNWIDLHNLVRIDGKWKITNKTATHSSR